MKGIRIERRLPSVDEFRALRAAVGWGIPATGTVERGLRGSIFGLCAVDDGVVVGAGRIVGDGGLVYLVADVMIAPEFRRLGIGTAVMERLMAFIHGEADSGAVVGVMASLREESFYERFGFVRRPSSRYGAGMIIPGETVGSWASRRTSR